MPEVTGIARDLDPALILADPDLAQPLGCTAPTIPLDRLMQMAGHPPAPPHLGDPDRPAYMIYTSGTSGRPRAVVHAHRAIWARRMMAEGWYGLTADDRLLHAGAMNWSFTLGTGLFDPWTVGATALVPGPGVTPADLPALLRRSRATLFAAAPAVYRQMLKSGARLHLPDLRHGLTAGERLSDLTRAAWTAATGRPIHPAYGLSEVSTFISSCPDRPAPPGTTGYPQPGRRITILGVDGQPVPPGADGLIAVHRTDPGLFLTYHGADADHAARFHGDWFLTGDLGRMAPDGAVTVLGRSDEMMNPGGYRLSPDEVEGAFALCPGAGDLAVIERKLADDLSILVAFYTGEADKADLQAWAASALARYKQPRDYLRLTALPRTANGKLNRRALRDMTNGETG